MKAIRIGPLTLLFLLGPAMPGCQPDPDDRTSDATDPTLSTISDSAGVPDRRERPPPGGLAAVVGSGRAVRLDRRGGG